MKTKIITAAIIALFLVGFSTLGITPRATAHTESDPFVTDLIAGQFYDVGDVLVWNDGSFLYVKYMTTGGWYLGETHLAVATVLSDIPHTSKGNPVPGLFEFSADHAVGTTEYTYQIDLDWSPGTDLYIAAHAGVCGPGSNGMTPAEGLISTVTLWTFPTPVAAGSVSVSIVGTDLVVTFQTTGDWVLLDTQLGFSMTPFPFPPPWWTFPYVHIGLGGVTTDTYTIPMSSLGIGVGDTIYVSVHAWMRGLDEFNNMILSDGYADENPFDGWQKYFAITIPAVPVVCETAWGKGTRFVQTTWAMYFTYEVQ